MLLNNTARLKDQSKSVQPCQKKSRGFSCFLLKKSIMNSLDWYQLLEKSIFLKTGLRRKFFEIYRRLGFLLACMRRISVAWEKLRVLVCVRKVKSGDSCFCFCASSCEVCVSNCLPYVSHWPPQQSNAVSADIISSTSAHYPCLEGIRLHTLPEIFIHFQTQPDKSSAYNSPFIII